jgi:uncharacterized membrane protein YcgQ (UPF0703/DUF1980 family)
VEKAKKSVKAMNTPFSEVTTVRTNKVLYTENSLLDLELKLDGEEAAKKHTIQLTGNYLKDFNDMRNIFDNFAGGIIDKKQFEYRSQAIDAYE